MRSQKFQTNKTNTKIFFFFLRQVHGNLDEKSPTHTYDSEGEDDSSSSSAGTQTPPVSNRLGLNTASDNHSMKSHTPLSIKSEHASSHNRSPSAATMASHINSSGANTNLGGSLSCMSSTSPYGTPNMGASTGSASSLCPQPSPLSIPPPHSAVTSQPTHYNPLHYQTSVPANSSSMLMHQHHHNHALLYPHAHHHHHSTNEWYQAAAVAAATTPSDPMNHLNHFSHHPHHLMHHATAY